MRAGSGLVQVGPRLLAIQDDAWQAWWIEPRRRSLQPRVLKGNGGPKRKRNKPDFEAVFALPDGTIWILGSGATPRRCRMARLKNGQVSMHDAVPLYAALEAALGMRPNIEGAVPMGSRLRLFHRGPGRARQANAMLDVSLEVLMGGVPQVLAVRGCDLGSVARLHLGFTDAVALDADRILYLAAAEDTRDGIADGVVAGASIGVIGGNHARWALLREADGAPSRRKVEGIALDQNRCTGYLLTDPDDAARPAELCRVTLKGFD